MLVDPENTEEWEVEVWAENSDTAQSRCEAIAERYSPTEVINVTQITKNPSPQGQYKFICWFRSEAQES